MGKSTQYQRAYVNIKVDTNVATVCFMPEHNLQVILKFNQNKYKEKFQGKEVWKKWEVFSPSVHA